MFGSLKWPVLSGCFRDQKDTMNARESPSDSRSPSSEMKVVTSQNGTNASDGKTNRLQPQDNSPSHQSARRLPDHSGTWLLNLEASQHDEMAAIMRMTGVPSWLVALGRNSRTTMKVEQEQGGLLIKETIVQLGGLYNHKIELFTDGREVVSRHPLNGSLIRTRTTWEEVAKKDLEPCNLSQESVMCCVSRAVYGKYLV